MSGMGALAQKIESLQKENAELKKQVGDSRLYHIDKVNELRAQLAIAVTMLETITEEPWSIGPEVPSPAKLAMQALAKINQKPVAVVEVGCIGRPDNKGWSADEHLKGEDYLKGTLIVWGKDTDG